MFPETHIIAGSESTARISPMLSEPVPGTLATSLSLGCHRLPEPTLTCTQGRLQVPRNYPIPVSILRRDPYPVFDRCGSIDTLSSLTPWRGYFRHGFTSFPKSFPQVVSFRITSCSSWLDNISFWLTLLSPDWSLPSSPHPLALPTAPKHCART